MTIFDRKRIGCQCWHDYEIGTGWTNYTLVHVDVECEHFTGVSELSLALLGVHLRLWWIHNPVTHQALADRVMAPIDGAER
jgi:hypothetical protein